MRKDLLEIIDRFPSRRIAVIGDLIADEFLYGQIARVSREAPVLVLEYRDLATLPGGAANAANNLLDLGCRVSIAGSVGRDHAADNLLSILRGKKANLQAVQKIKGYGTPIKTRILAGAHHSAPQQIVRVDRVSMPEPPPPLQVGKLERNLRSADGIILSDYGYGTIVSSLVDSVSRAAREKGVPVVVDSRFRMSEFYSVTSITPNITELEASLGISIGSDQKLLHKIGRQVLKKQRLDSLLVTQGRFGMTLFEMNRAPLHIPIFGTDEVADVTGAGDTVIAVFTLALACGAGFEASARLANYAGGIVVMKRGTATVTCDELRNAVKSEARSQKPEARI